MSTKNKKLAYKIGQLLAKTIYLIGIYTILSYLNIFKVELVTDTINSCLEIVIFNNLFIWNL